MPESQNNKSSALVAIDFHGSSVNAASGHLIPLAFDNRAIRAEDEDGRAWFVADDVCAALSVTRTQVRKLDADEKGVRLIHTLGGDQDMVCLTEAGVYTLALRCRDAMKPGTAPYRFRKWVTGVALPALRRGNEPGVVHGVDRDTMKAIGGMLKGIVNKAIAETVPAMVDAELMKAQAAVARGLTAGEVIVEAGVTDRKGLRGLPRRVSDRLRRYSSEIGVAVKIGRLGSTSAYVFDGSVVRRWLNEAGGKQFIKRLADEKRGQGTLRLVNGG